MAEEAVVEDDEVEEGSTVSAPPESQRQGADPAGVQPARQEAPRATPTGTGGEASITVRDRFIIFPGRSIPDLDMPNALAYEVEDKRKSHRTLYALVCNIDMVPRVSVMRVLKGTQIPHMIQMVDFGVAEWPPIDKKAMIVIYQRPMGGRVMTSLSSRIERVPDHLFAKSVVKPIMEALRELEMRGITHRAIRPDNLYWVDNNKDKFVIGDCVTAAPGCDQPVVLETIESGMTLPTARGSGLYSDDMYALGATMIFLALGYNPMQTLSSSEIIEAKLRQGSYAAIAGENRLPVSLIECLRGLLTDEPSQRWTVNNLDLWLNGKRLTPLQPRAEKQAQRPFLLDEEEYRSTRLLAFAMHRQWDLAQPMVQDGTLEIWLRRGLEDNDLADAISAAIKTANGMPDKGVAAEVLMCRALMILDPEAPVRFKDFCVTLDGFGAALAIALLRGHPTQQFVEFIDNELHRFWIAAQTKYIADHHQYDSTFKDMKTYVKDTAIGSGIERCVYEINEWLHCMSPLIADQHILEIKQLLPALDSASKNANKKMWPIDRHVAAYISARYAKGTQPQLDAMNDARVPNATLGMLSVLAILQWRLGPDSLFNLTSWVGGLMGPVINQFNNRQKRKEMERELPKLVRKGSLPELFNVLDNADERRRDAEGFTWAKAEYLAADKQIFDLERGQANRDEQAVATGRQYAAVGAAVVMMLSFIGSILSNAF